MSEFLRFAFTQPPPRPDGSGLWSIGAHRWATATRTLVRDAIKAKAPVSKNPSGGGKPGAFRASITQHTKTKSNSIIMEFGSPKSYTPFLVDGTRPHMIVPKSARVLHFRTAAGDVFARRVNHPGTRPNDFTRRAVLPLLPEVQDSFSLIMREVFGGAP